LLAFQALIDQIATENMAYEYDVIISYAQGDDEPIKAGQGWVTNLHRFLGTLLNQITKDTVKFHLICDSDSVAAGEFEKAPVLINVLSPKFVKAAGLISGAESFCKFAEGSGGLEIGGVSRLFKVIKFPGKFDKFLPEYEKIVNYDLFQLDPSSGDAQEFQSFFGHDAERSYWMKLVDMAYDINHLLINLANKVKEKEEQNKRKKDKTIYLASTGVDMVIQRDIIKRELIRHGYRILPEHSLPKEVKALEAMVKKDLKRSELAIHMVGEDYGYRPKGSEHSVIDIQNKLADEYSYSVVAENKKRSSITKPRSVVWFGFPPI